MPEEFKNLEFAGEFTVNCTLANGTPKTLRFKSTSSAEKGSTDLFVKADFFGGDGSYLIKNRLEVLVNISLGLPVTMNLGNSFSILINPGEVTIINPKPHIPTPPTFYKGVYMDEYQLLCKNLAQAKERVTRLENLLEAYLQSNDN